MKLALSLLLAATLSTPLASLAAESHDLVNNAQAKRVRKGIPLLVGNIGPLTFGQDDNEMLLVDEHGVQPLPRASKLVLARQLVAEIARRQHPPTSS